MDKRRLLYIGIEDYHEGNSEGIVEEI